MGVTGGHLKLHAVAPGGITCSATGWLVDDDEITRPAPSASIDPRTHRYSGKQAAEVAGISYRQLDYWARTDLLRPSHTDASGSGSRRSYSYDDVFRLRVIAAMLEAGIKLEHVRSAFQRLSPDLTAGGDFDRLVIGGGRGILVSGDDQLLEVIRSGQFVMTNLLSLHGIHAELLAEARAVLESARAAA